ncbi:MAG: staygreen family protein [Brevefilum sp.]
MSALDPRKLHIQIDEGSSNLENPLSRKYTLTHSDITGKLFLTIAFNYDAEAISGIYSQLMRDEVLGDWLNNKDGLELHIHLHVSGGLVLGSAKWRESKFKQHLPLVLEAICFGDRAFLIDCQACLEAPILVHFHAKQTDLDHYEKWGNVKDYVTQ